MKKIFISILSIVICFSTVACSCKKEEKVTLEDAQYVEEGKISFLPSFDLIQEKIDNKVTFVFYMYGATCSGCHAFTPILEEYVEEKGIEIYAVEINMVAAANPTLKEKMGYTPSIAVIKEGEFYQGMDASKSGSADIFSSKEEFAKWFESYVNLK